VELAAVQSVHVGLSHSSVFSMFSTAFELRGADLPFFMQGKKFLNKYFRNITNIIQY
jgi:hypothetical protein